MNYNYLDEISWQAITETIGELRSPKSEYWHYTTLKTLESIFGKMLMKVDYFNVNYFSYAEMFASNIRYLNDAKEFDDGKAVFKQFENEIQSTESLNDEYMDNVYLISFCGKGDLLSQWKYYGKESGIAVKFNFNNVNFRYWKTIKNKHAKVTRSTNRFNLSIDYLSGGYDYFTKPIQVKYTKKEKENYYNDLVGIDSIKLSDALRANLFIPFCKHESFQDEQESRLVFYAHKFDTNQYDNNTIVPNIVYNFGKTTVKPALKVEMFCKNAHKNIIDEIVVGPGFNQALLYNALIHMFDRSNYHFCDEKNDKQHECENGIIIRKSDIPFRGD